MRVSSLIWVIGLLSTFACTSSKKITLSHIPTPNPDTTIIKVPLTQLVPIISFADGIKQALDTTKALNTGFSGLELVDLETNEVIFSHNADKYFVAASNIKLFTLYTCLKSLEDSITAIRYVESDTTFTFWGQADPTFLHPYFSDAKVLDFLKTKASTKRMILASDGELSHYGQGWMWDDYNDYYQAEITAFPMHGNVFFVHKDTSGLVISPPYLLIDTSTLQDVKVIKRALNNNHFDFPVDFDSLEAFHQEIPYKDALKLNPILLENLLQKPISLQNLAMPHYAIKLYSLPIDTILRRMMKESDNMLAEHLLLASGMEVMDTLSSSETIKWSKTTLLSDIPHKPIWVDGSGLSRYNRCTPSSILYLLKKMYREIDEKKLFSLLLEGGNLTLKSMDATEIKPFVFAKTGSMTGVYNLSGYLITAKGKKLAFSFMNNNFNGKVSTVKKAVEKILLDVWRAN